MPPAQCQLLAGGAQPSSAECLPPDATMHPPPVPTLPLETQGEEPGQAPAGAPATAHDQEAGHDQAADQDKLVAASGETPPVE